RPSLALCRLGQARARAGAAPLGLGGSREHRGPRAGLLVAHNRERRALGRAWQARRVVARHGRGADARGLGSWRVRGTRAAFVSGWDGVLTPRAEIDAAAPGRS